MLNQQNQRTARAQSAPDPFKGKVWEQDYCRDVVISFLPTCTDFTLFLIMLLLNKKLI